MGYKVPKIGLVLYLGNLTEEVIRGGDRYLIQVLLASSKKAITRAWNKPEPPTKEQCLDVVEKMYPIESLNYILKLE